MKQVIKQQNKRPITKARLKPKIFDWGKVIKELKLNLTPAEKINLERHAKEIRGEWG